MSGSNREAEAPNGVSWSLVSSTLRIVASGYYELDEVRRAIGQGASLEYAPHNAMILDLTASRESRTADELRALAADLERHRRAISHRCAIVVSDSLRYGLGRMLQVFSEGYGVSVRPFRDPDEASKWIQSHASA